MNLIHLGLIEGQELHTDSHSRSLYIGDVNTPDYITLLISSIPAILDVVESEDSRRLYESAYNTYLAYSYLLEASLENLDCKQICNDYDDPYLYFYQTLGKASGNDTINKAVARKLVDKGNASLEAAYDHIYPAGFK